MRNLQVSMLALLMAVGLGGIPVIPDGWGTARAKDEAEQLVDSDNELPLAELERLTEVYGRIKRDYVERVDDEELFKAAIRGMLAELDGHSSYLDAEELAQLREGTSGEFGGVGLELSSDNGFVQVVAPIDDTPASRAGLQTGDIITRVDGESVRGIGISRIVTKLRGEPGSEVSLTVVREDAGEPLTFTLQRATIQVDSVRSRTLLPGYGYIRISQFQQRTAKDLRQAIDKLQEKHREEDLQGMILDLRNNPGGILNAAISVADTFLAEGRIIYTQGRAEESRTVFNADGTDHIDGVPLVILINRGSASASEIVAGSLQDHNRAIIMGQTSFGKGSVQSVVPLGGPAMKLTTARYYTPEGRSIDKKGVVPDIKVEELRLAAAKETQYSRQAELEGLVPKKQEADTDEDKLSDLAREDYTLYEALNLLQGLHIVTNE